MPERTKGAVLKTVEVLAISVGSNPTPSATVSARSALVLKQVPAVPIGDSMVSFDPVPGARPPEEPGRAALAARAATWLVDTLQASIVLLDRQAVVTYVSDPIATMLGCAPGAIVGQNAFELVHPDDLDPAVATFQRAIAGTAPASHATVRLRRQDVAGYGDDGWHWVRAEIRNALDDPEVGALVLSITDHREQVETAERARRLDEIVEATPDLVLTLDPDFVVTWANPAAHALLPEATDTDRVHLEQRVPRWVARTIVDEVVPVLERDGIWSGEAAVLDADDRAVPVSATWIVHRNAVGTVRYMSIIARDISGRLELERKLSVQARTDALTGVGSRQAALDGVRWASTRGPVAMSVIDIESFRSINDAHGQLVGDAVLAEVGRRLRSQVFSSQVVARLGGDEFAVVWPGIDDDATALSLTRRLLGDVLGRVTVGDANVSVRLRAGVAFGQAGCDATTLLGEATRALRRAKELDEAVVGFDDELRHLTIERLALAGEIPAGIERNEFEPWVQPVVNAATGAVSHLEALVRWRHPTRGLLFPNTFIPVAEETGTIVELGHAVIERACAHAAEWRKRPELADVRVAVNVSARQLVDPRLGGALRGALDRHGLPADAMLVEITESLLMTDFEVARPLLDELRGVGVHVAIDDFGTGYSSLAYLQQLPIDVLKIDRRFISPLDEGRAADHSLVQAIVSIGSSLGLAVVAEGVETQEQARILRDLGVDMLQGYLYAKPMPPDELIEWHRGHAGRSGLR